MQLSISDKTRLMSFRTISFAAILFSSVVVRETPATASTYCNPLDLDYQYNFEEKWRNISYRSGADPVIVVQRG
ncbi:MAG TPA: hypothetical protein VFP96_11690, partial [Candidatus Acidoferrum sp.]|nr:hypothetical protein [Candidatus Acidoferrum sp.]